MQDKNEEEIQDQQSDAPTELSPEEIKKLRAQRSNFYNEQLKYLKPEKDYHVMLAEIEEAKTRQVKAKFTQAQIFMAMQEQPTPQEEAAAKGKDHVVVQEDLDTNPDMIEQGIKVGDTIQVPLDYTTAGAPTEHEGQE